MHQPRLPYGNSTSGLLLQDRKPVTCTCENDATSATPLNEPTSAKLVGATTPRPIAQALPEINRHSTRRCGAHVCGHTRTLISDFEFRVRIGYQPVTRDYQIHANHLCANLNPEPVAREIERELDFNH